jgi:hypothetical protein
LRGIVPKVRDQGWQSMVEFWRGNGTQRNDLAKTETGPPTAQFVRQDKKAQTVLICDIPAKFFQNSLKTIDMLFRT